LFNDAFNQRLLDFNETEGRWPTYGEAYQRAKNGVLSSNTRNFALLGDPGLLLGLPAARAVLTHINTQPVDSLNPDTLRALATVTMRGEIRNTNSQPDASFNGEVTISLFDKFQFQKAFVNNDTFRVQKALLFRGLASVTQGNFQFTFTVPLDISYKIGRGNVLLYAEAPGNRHALGCSDDFIICCSDTNALLSTAPPTVQVFINDENWIAGSVTDANPWLKAIAQDDQGINTTGLGVGRELTATLNQDGQNPIVLNEYYTARKDLPTTGDIAYQLRDLPAGRYSVSLKVWDVSNNSGTGETEFLVADNAELALENVLNYPNPFTTNTTFFLNHNRVGEEVDVQIRIYTISGRLVKFLRTQLVPDGNIVNALNWDGLDEFGDRIGRGVYLYEVRLHVPRTGETATQIQKLVLLR
jgi:hypothetical protein